MIEMLITLLAETPVGAIESENFKRAKGIYKIPESLNEVKQQIRLN